MTWSFVKELCAGSWNACAFHVARCRVIYTTGLVLLILVGTSVSLVLSPPKAFPASEVFVVSQGESIGSVAQVLEERHYISSALLFKALLRVSAPNRVQAGRYVFQEPASIVRVAYNLSHGIAGVPTIKVTFPEGTTVRQMGAVLGKAIPGFDEQKFDSAGIPAEGYLFPDTYFFLPSTTEEDAVAIMRANYRVHIKNYETSFQAFGKSEREIITMASLLEGEGKTLTDKRMIAGILWHRIQIGMPLQVDAVFGYDYGRTGYVPTAADLKSNSAYNTYRYKGLPPTPINNPGDVSIEAAITPTKSAYLYYLTGTDGKMYYAKTFAEHIKNQVHLK